MHTKRIGILFFIVAGLSIGASGTWAQTVTGTLSGHISDKSGATVPQTKVTAINEQTGAIREATTNNDGFYQFSFLAIGSYKVTVALQGFRSVEKDGVVVELNKNTVSDFVHGRTISHKRSLNARRFYDQVPLDEIDPDSRPATCLHAWVWIHGMLRD